MGGHQSIVALYARNGGRLLLERAPDGWRGLERPLEDTPEETAASILTDVLDAPEGSNIVTLGDPIVGDDREVELVPVLAEVYSRELTENADGLEWRHATDIVSPGDSSEWSAYRSIGPTRSSVIEDVERGSTALSLDALQLLRDEAATGASWNDIVSTALDIIESRGELTALVSRVDRTMNRAASADDRLTALSRIACEEIDEAVQADAEAASRAAHYCEGKTILTLSQSGTVQAALSEGRPSAVYLLESRPECEAVPVAETLASEDIDVSLLLDAGIGDVMCRRDIDVVLIGADSVSPNGDVWNKVGTRTLVTNAYHEGIPVIAVTSSDKIAHEPSTEVWVDGSEIYDGPHDITTDCRMFDRTPPDLITTLVTEVGELTPNITVWIAAERRKHRVWRDHPERLTQAG